MSNNRFGNVKLHHLVARYKTDMRFKDKYPEKKEFFERRLERHIKDIIDYVTDDAFEATINRLDI